MSECKYQFKDHKDKHVIIEASAGTGKTYTIEKMIPQFIEGGISIEKIAVLTFTEKAAAELQDRIRNELSRMVAKPNLDLEQKSKFEEAIELLPNANIGTIHHFCRTLIKRHSLKLGLSAKFGEIKNSNEEIELYFKKFWWEIEKDDSEELIQLLKKVEFPKFKDLLIQLTEKSGGKKIKLLEKRNFTSTEKNFQKIKSLVDKCDLTPTKPAYLEKLRTFHDQTYSNTLQKLTALKNTFFTADLAPNQNIQKFILSKNSIGELEYTSILKSLLQEFEQEISIEILNPIFEYANQLIEEFEKYLILQDKISLDGLILKARDLVSDVKIKKQIQKEIQYIILDECQDTNPIQIDLLTKLFEGLPTGIIFVGDPKQSIYRFRNADLVSYNAAIQGMQSKYELRLDTSFRSSKRLIDAFNYIFPHFQSLSQIYKPVESNRQYDGFEKRNSPPLILLGLDSKFQPKLQDNLGNKYTADSLRKDAMAEIINVIKTISDNDGYLIEDKSSATGFRRIKFSDIAILANSNASLNTLLREFSRESISANIYKSHTFYSHKIVQAISYLLHAIENPNDSSSLYKALASDLFLISESVLYLLSEAGELSYLLDTDIPEINYIYESMRRAHENRYIKDVAYTLQEILKENRILEILSIGFEGKRNIANIYHLSEILSYTQLTENLSFGEIVRKLKKDVENSVEQEIKLDNDKKDDSFNSVQLMTIHASKGLEFPVCILYDLAASSKPDTTSLFIKDSFLREDPLDVELKIKLANEEEIVTSGFKDEFSKNVNELLKERDRLLYVGFTRAKDFLVLPLHSLEKQRSNSLRSLIDKAFESNNIQTLIDKKLATIFTESFLTKEIIVRKEKEFTPLNPVTSESIQLLSISAKDMYNKSGIKIQSYSSIARHFKEEAEEELVKEKVVIEKNTISENESNPAIVLSSEKKGTTFGLLCHAVMENFNLKNLTDEKKTEEEVLRLVNEYYPDTGLNDVMNYSRKDAVEICLTTLQKSYAMDEDKTEFAKIKDWKYLVREKSFYYKLKSNKMDYLIGIGDGMFFWNNKYYLLDWKTNLIKPTEHESIDKAIQKKVRESYHYQYMIYSMNLIENIISKKEDKRLSWEKNFGGMLFIFMRIKEDNQGSLLVKPSYDEIMNFKKVLEN